MPPKSSSWLLKENASLQTSPLCDFQPSYLPALFQRLMHCFALLMLRMILMCVTVLVAVIIK